MDTRPLRLDLLATPTGRRWLFALLYLSEGAPIGFIWWAMPTLLRARGVGLEAITTLTTLATLPWTMKFLAAPLIDASLHRSVALKRWILSCQLGMTVALLPLAALDWSGQLPLVVAAVVVHAAFAAVQDVGIDTLAVHTVPSEELGRVNGWMQAGMLGGRAGVAAGAAVLAGAHDHPGYAVALLALLVALPALALLLGMNEPPLSGAPVRLRGIAGLVATREGLAGIAVALLAGAGFEFFGVSAGPRLLDLGVPERSLALFYGLLAPAGLAAGALVGGALTDRIGPLRGTSVGLAASGAVLVWIAVADRAPGPAHPHLAWFTGAYVTIGVLTAGSYALFMSLSRGEYAATRFSLFMAMTNACEAWSGFVGGRLAAHGYGAALAALVAVASLAAVPLYVMSRDRSAAAA